MISFFSYPTEVTDNCKVEDLRLAGTFMEKLPLGSVVVEEELLPEVRVTVTFGMPF